MSVLYTQEIPTPLGLMTAVASDRGLLLCEFSDRPMLPKQFDRMATLFGEFPEIASNEYLDQTRRELAEYFAATRESFSVPLAPEGTSFQQSVWAELLRIPFGMTTSYERLAQRIERPGAARAVGRANGSNPIAIIVPCHRVVGADGSLTGYGGGQRRKRWLLTHEQRGLQLPLPDLLGASRSSAD